MRSLVRGERLASLFVMLGLTAVICAFMALLFLVFDYREQLRGVDREIEHLQIQLNTPSECRSGATN